METFPLHVAARNGDETRSKHLIELGFSVDSRDDLDFTPLHHAAAEGHLQIAQFLINENCDLNALAPNGKTALLFAAQNANCDMVELLLKSGADTKYSDKNRWNILHFVCHYGWLNIAQHLMSEKGIIDARTSKGNSPLLMAAQKNCRDIFDQLVKAGADMKCRNTKNETVLHYAVRKKGWLDVVRYFTNEKWHLDSQTSYGKTPVTLAVQYCQGDALRLLIEAGAKNNIPEDALLRACRKGSLELVNFFISQKFDLDIRNGYGETPLFIASYFGHRKIVNLLIESGACATIPSQVGGCTVLQNAVIQKWLDVVSNIIKVCPSRNDIDASDDYIWRTPLHSACSNGSVEIAELLIKAGADIRAQDAFDNTPLLIAINQQEPKFQIIDLLLKYGSYCYPREVVQVYENPEVIEYIFADAGRCATLVINRFNKTCLPRIYLFPGATEQLPLINMMEISSQESTAYRETVKCVENEIQTKTYCNVEEVQPIVLKMLCVKALFKYCEMWDLNFPPLVITRKDLEDFCNL